MKRNDTSSRWKRAARFIYNREKGTFVGRTCKSWGQIFVFYVIAYSFLGTFFYGMMAIFMKFYVNPRVPNLTGMQSVLKFTPGVGIHPRVTKSDSFIHLTNYSSELNTNYLIRARRFLETYKNTEENIDCSGANLPNSYVEKPCRFPLSQLGPCQDPEAAILAGSPCVYVRLNKIYGWLPDIDNKSGFTDASIRCTGQNPSDVLFMGKPVYYPKMTATDGMEYGVISNVYFPYLNQPGYQTPIVAVQFPDLRPSTLVLINCQVYGLVGDHESVNFEIAVDGHPAS